MTPFRLLGIFPHPDDESYSCAGTLARLASRGALVQLVCATSGEAGQNLRENGSDGNLRRLREQELRRACETLGILPPRLLGLPDGGLGRVDFPTVAGALVKEIREFRPHAVVSLGPDGAYGHPDHLALHRLVVAAYGAAGGGERFSGDLYGEPWTPFRLFFAAFPRGMFRPMYEHMLGSEYETAIRGLDLDKLGVEPQEVAATVDIRDVSQQKLAAIACHRSQLRDDEPFSLFPDDLVRRLLSVELFTLGDGQPAPPLRRWRDLDEDLTLDG